MNYENRKTYGVFNRGTHLVGVTRSHNAQKKSATGLRSLMAKSLIGSRVINLNRDYLGEIKEIMFDVVSGKVTYVVLSFGKQLGMGIKLFAVPWNALTIDAKAHSVVLNASKDQLCNAPGFDPNGWPDVVDPSWINHLHSLYTSNCCEKSIQKSNQFGIQQQLF